MSTNISKAKRERLVEKIKAIKTYIASVPQDENTAQLLAYIAEIEKDIKGKKYGLVFEEHKEQIDELLETHTPVLTEEADLFIDNGGNINFLIEGDNLASLRLLEKTHKGKIDLIYIDPPYNTGNKDFVYDDSFVDNNDTFRHSKWLSFMEKRLQFARDLLSENGVIFISIDDNEQSQLKMLCDNIFGEQNFISNSFVLDNLKGKTNDNFITSIGSRIIVYSKNKKQLAEFGFNKVENVFAEKVENKYSLFDDEGFYNLVTFKKTGQSKFREDRPYMYYPILHKEGTLYSITLDEYARIYNSETRTFDDEFIESLKEKYYDYDLILPLSEGGQKLRWTSGFNTFLKKINVDILYDNGVKQKVRPDAAEMLQVYSSGTPKSLMYKTEYSSGTEDLKRIIPDNAFDFPKPIQLIIDLLTLPSIRINTILDFFAGSGTTGHAVMKLNAEDGGNRRFILCTNNENNICRDVTYERIRRVIEKERYPASLKYFKVDYLPISDKLYYEYADELLLHIRELVELENGIDFRGNSEIAIVLTEQELDELTTVLDGTTCKTVYLGHDVLPSEEQLTLFKKNNIVVNIIPDYYYRDLEG